MERRRPQEIETPGQRFGRLIRQGAEAYVAIADTAHDPKGKEHEEAQDKLAAVKDEFGKKCLHGNGYDDMLTALFEDRIVHRVLGIQQDRRDERRAQGLKEVLAERRTAIAGDWPIIRREFPGQFPEPDYELQSTLGDVPPRK